MQKFLKENWLRILSLVFTAIVAVVAFYFAYILNQKSLPDLQPKNLNANRISDNQNANLAQTDDFVCPEDYNDAKAQMDGLAKQIKKIQDEDPEMTVEEFGKRRHQQLVDHGCEKTLFNMSAFIFPEALKFMGKTFSPKTTDVDKDTKVRSIFYPLKGQKAGEADEEIIINFFVQGVWGDDPFTSKDVVMNTINRPASDGYKIENKFEGDSENKDQPTYLLTTSKLYPEEKYGGIYMEKYGTTDNGDIYCLTFTKNIQGEEATLEKDIANWLKKNNTEYLRAINNLEFFTENDNTDSDQPIEKQDPTFNNGIIELQQKEDPASQ